ncbi:MAG: ABC transporter ATP-binding protein [Gammaproteobacteria bacterium]|nr:ABC transporter ATP-binding protein [Gammaproteobacteria bacterium]
MAAQPVLLQTRALCKRYFAGDTVVDALADASLQIERGEYVAVMGPSGSGKSTLMNVLGFLDRPTTGDYLFDGENTATMNPDQLAALRNRSIGFVFQSFNLLPRQTAAGNVALPLLYSSVPRRERQARALAALQRVGLADRAHHLPSQLSGGQNQRVAIARALVNAPELLLADEPTGALDSVTGAEIMDLFAELNDSGITVIIVTHDETIARRTKRVIRFLDGRIVADSAPPAELRA